MDQILDLPVVIKIILLKFPFWGVLLFIVGFYTLLTLFFFWLIPRISRVRNSDRYQGVLLTFIGVVGAFYGILFGLVNINLWQSYHQVQNIVSREASDFSKIVLNSAAFEPAMHEKVLDGVRNYVRIVRNDEWIKMREGNSSPQAWAAIDHLFPLLQSYQPRTPTETSFYNTVLNNLNDAMAARRERIDLLQNSVPPPLYRVLVLGSFLLIFFVSLVASKIKKRRASLLVFSIIVNVLIAFNLYLVIDLGNPFLGRIAIKSTPFSEGTLAQFK